MPRDKVLDCAKREQSAAYGTQGFNRGSNQGESRRCCKFSESPGGDEQLRALSRKVRERKPLNLDNPKRLGTDAFTASRFCGGVSCEASSEAGQ